MLSPPTKALSAVKALPYNAALLGVVTPNAPYPVAPPDKAGATAAVASYTLVKPVLPDKATSNTVMLAVAVG